MRFKRPTKAHELQLNKLDNALGAASRAVFAAGPNRDTRFSDCLDLADETTRQAYEDANRAHRDFLRMLADQGRGYFDQGRFRAYS